MIAKSQGVPPATPVIFSIDRLTRSPPLPPLWDANGVARCNAPWRVPGGDSTPKDQKQTIRDNVMGAFHSDQQRVPWHPVVYGQYCRHQAMAE